MDDQGFRQIKYHRVIKDKNYMSNILWFIGMYSCAMAYKKTLKLFENIFIFIFQKISISINHFKCLIKLRTRNKL